MSKLSKLVKTPGPFFRDLLLKRYPPAPPRADEQAAPPSPPAETPVAEEQASAAEAPVVAEEQPSSPLPAAEALVVAEEQVSLPLPAAQASVPEECASPPPPAPEAPAQEEPDPPPLAAEAAPVLAGGDPVTDAPSPAQTIPAAADAPVDIYAPIWPALPTDHARQSTSQAVAAEVLATTRVETIVDLGCGSGVAVDWITARDEGIGYIGVDIEWSPQVAKRTRTDARFVTYDGVHLPFEDATVEFIYTNQVLEHVRDPYGLIRDVARVLRPGGYFVGSVSQMEPYHSFSVFNWTIFGVHHVFADAGLVLRRLRPGIDVCSLVDWWRHRKDRTLYSPFWEHESALNHQIDLVAAAQRWTVERTNLEKLLFAGQICFIAQRPGSAE